MFNIDINKDRDTLEAEIRGRGFTLDWEDRDDQIWTNNEQDVLLFVSWINCSIYVYERKQIISM